YAQAKANWISDVAPAFVTHATAVATADGQAAYDIAVARGNRNVIKADADLTFANAQSAQSYTRAVDAIAPTNTHLSSLLGLENARRSLAATHTQSYEHKVAVAEKKLGIDKAQASKQLEIDRANKVEADTYNHTYAVAVGDAKLGFDTAIADAKLAWQQDEITSQEAFTTNSVPLHHAFSVAIIGLDKTYQTQVAIAEETRQYTHATAEGNFFVAETTANNTKRSSTAAAVIALWNAHEVARVDAHSDINNALQLPWTQYLVDAASARASWWNSASSQYTNLASDRNTAETTYTARIAAAHVTRQQAIATAKKTKSLAEADAEAAEATAKADAVREYFTDMVLPTKTYANQIATAERKKAVDIAQANRDYIDHESTTQRDSEIQAAGNAFTSTKNSQDATYRSALAGEQADQYLDFATAEFNRTVALVAADVALVTARNNAEKTYRNEESDAYLQSATSWANIDAVYRQYEANSFASAAASLASSTGSPWAAYDADFYAAQAANVTAVSNAAKTDAIAQATAQKAAEIAQTNAETTWRNANATLDGTLKTTIASAHLGFATAQSFAYGASGGSGLPLPSVASPADLTGQYTVAGPSNTYRRSIYFVSNTTYAYPYGGYWWGAWGYYGSGYWYAGYGGYYDYLYGSQVSSAASVYLTEPAKQFPASFWQIDAGEIADQMRDGSVQVRYGEAVAEDLAITDSVQPGAFTPASPIDPSVSDGAAFVNDEVIAILSGFDSEAGDYWALHGSTAQTVVSARPTATLEKLSPELVNAILNKLSHLSSGGTEYDATSAIGALHECASPGDGSLKIAEQLATKATGTNGSTTLAQHLGRGDGANLTPMQKLKAYLQGVNNQKGPGIFDQAAQISVNLVMGYINGQNGNVTEYAKGFAKGFFIDGAWGNVEGIGTILKFGWGAVKQSWYNQARILTFGNERIFENQFFNFEDQRKLEANVIKAGEMIFKVLNAVGTELGEEAFAHYHALKEGSAAELEELGGKHQQVAAAVMSIGVLISRELREMPPETRGRISGAITWEIAQTAAEILFTAGAATVATKGAKFARIADKLADFAKTYDKLGDIAGPVLTRLRQISEPGGELRKLLEKFDEKAVVVERAIKVIDETLQSACFTPGTLVLTEQGTMPIGDIRQGDKVKAFDFKSGRWSYHEVKANTRNQYSGDIVSVTIGSDTIEATAEHPFWVVTGEGLSNRPTPKSLANDEDQGHALMGRWVSASDLAPGDVLQSSLEHHATISAISRRMESNLEVCNLSVGQNHSYAVGSTSILVHNANWCGVLTELHPGWAKIRANLAKKFGVDIRQIHGHHIVQKAIPDEFDLRPAKLPKGKLIRNLSDTEFEALVSKGLLSDTEQSAWYIGKSHELLKKADVEVYAPKDGISEDDMVKLLKQDLEDPKPGRSGANLTLALNDKANVHTVETQRAVYKRLKKVEGDQARTEDELRAIGDIFRAGNVPTETSFRRTRINGEIK
ncbi:MAG: Hint domain-containing protein, partial [Aureliella sp.]